VALGGGLAIALAGLRLRREQRRDLAAGQGAAPADPDV
jgi:hypothetical protein